MIFNYLCRDVFKVIIYGYFSKWFVVVEQYINLDFGLKDLDVSVDFKVYFVDFGVFVLVGYRNCVYCFYFVNIYIYIYLVCVGFQYFQISSF